MATSPPDPPGARPRPPEVSTVFFDLDDTLFDHTFGVEAGLSALAAAFPAFARLPPGRLAQQHAAELERQHLRVLSGELTVDQARHARFEVLCRACGLPAEVDVGRVADLYRAGYLGARRAVPGAIELLRALRAEQAAIRIGVITNNVVTEQVQKLEALRMRHLIDDLVVSEEAGAAKPDPAIFRVALARAGCVDPAQAIMVGDAWTTDVVGARSVGMRAIWLNRHGRPCPEPGVCVQIDGLLPTEAVAASILGPSTDRRGGAG